MAVTTTTTTTSTAPVGGAGAIALDDSDLPSPQGQRHIIPAEQELRIEVAFISSSNLTIQLLKGSGEICGIELALRKIYRFDGGGIQITIFTYHGCIVDVDCNEGHIISYVSDESPPMIAYVNTHAQLEALRDEAAASAAAAAAAAQTATTTASTSATTAATGTTPTATSMDGPRVLVCGPSESGKSSLVKLLVAYATKLGRTPLWVDLDPNDNALSVPGTLSVCPMNRDALTVYTQVFGGIPPNTTSPLTMWHGSTNELNVELFRAQVSALGQKIDARLQHDDWERSSGIIVNTHGWIVDDGYKLLVHAIQALKISVVLIMGHDRLYSTLKNETSFSSSELKIIKVPRSGGVISREASFLRQVRSRSIRRYFYGDMVDGPNLAGSASGTGSESAPSPKTRLPQLTPFLAQIPFKQITLYKFTSLSLSSSLLPVASTQTTQAIQLSHEQISEQLSHRLLAVCHPHAVSKFDASNNNEFIYASGIAGVIAVERVNMDTEILHVLSPCAGALPSYTLLFGDITWMD